VKNEILLSMATVTNFRAVVRAASNADAALAELTTDHERDAAIKMAQRSTFTVAESANYIRTHGVNAFVLKQIEPL
jgi:hypothetical protein